MRKFKMLAFLAVFVLSLALVACGGGAPEGPQPTPTSVGDPVAGKATFDTVCIACHGPGGVGVEGQGKPFTTSEFLLTVDDQQLLTFIKTGRPISDPANTTGVDMPPKGGNPALTDDQLLDVIAYVRTLHQ
jgi:disulfide bond formation protein DsbB